MKLFIHGEEDPTQDKIYLRLKRGSVGISVVACDKNGVPHYCGNLLFFKPDGSVNLCSSINRDLGFRLDDAGRLIIYPPRDC